MKKIDLSVKQLKEEFKLKGVPGLRDIKNIISKMGYTLLTYESSEDLLKELKLTEQAKHYPSVSCTKGKKSYTFYRGADHSDDLPFNLCHEIGHIYMNHINYTSGYRDTSDHKEEEANVFATRLLYPQTQKSSKASALLPLLLLFTFTIGYLLNTNAVNTDSIPQEPTTYAVEPLAEIKTNEDADFLNELIIKVETASEKPSASPKAEIPSQSTQMPEEQPASQPTIVREVTADILDTTEQVVVTRTGRKYHKPTCSYLKNKTGTTTYTITEAESNYYAPCSRCF